MSDTLVHHIRSNLKAQSYAVNDSWLRECIEYYTSENTDVSLGTVQAFVTSQWVLSDLREINNEKGCLPPNFSRQDKIVLPGKYIIQVDKMCDISQSKYSQIKKIRSVSEDNVKATAIEAPAWKPKRKRMIQMYLTDGIQDFTAIEYRPIKALKDSLLPGCKLMIIGPVMCRKGIIMLSEENYKEIGGEVDSLLKVNALENVLARALGLKENDNPYADDYQENNAGQTDHAFPDDEFDIDLDEITQIERLSMEGREPRVDRNCYTDFPNPRDHISNRKTDQISTHNSSTMTARNYHNEALRDLGNNIQRKSSQVQIIEDSDDCYDNLNPVLDQNKTRVNDSKIVSSTQLDPIILLPTSHQFQDNGIDQFQNDVPSNNSRIDSRNYTNLPSISTASGPVFGADDCFDFDGFEGELNEHSFKKTNPVNIRTENALANNSSEVLSKSATNTPLITSNTSNPRGKSPTLSAGKRSAVMSKEGDMLSPLGSSTKIIRRETRPQVTKKNRKITDFTEKITPKEDIPPKICEFICDVVKEPDTGSVTYKTVRGKVTRVGKLLTKDGNWDLKATITDGTASLEIMFVSQVLEEFIGFTVSQFLEKKKLRKTNPEVEKYLRGGFRNAEIRVQQMDALMEVEFSAKNEIPKVVYTKELTEEQKQLIEKRMKMLAV